MYNVMCISLSAVRLNLRTFLADIQPCYKCFFLNEKSLIVTEIFGLKNVEFKYSKIVIKFKDIANANHSTLKFDIFNVLNQTHIIFIILV